MTITRSFGTNYTIPGMASRKWYAGKDGIQRWADNDQPMASDGDFIAAMSADLPPIHAPRSLDEMEASEGIVALCETCNGHGLIGGPSYYAPDEGGEPCPDCANQIQSNNSDIAVSESVLFPLTAELMAEGNACEERR